MIHLASKRRRRQRLAVLAPVVLVLALVAGCGSGDDGGDPVSATEHNDVDVAFATDMIQHHAQALAMVNLSVERSVDPAFKTLAEAIRAAQGPEIETMADWLKEWGEEVPETVNDHMNHDMGTMPEGTEDMPGMMSAAEMEGLESVVGDADFQRLWLAMMVRHHRGAIEMAEGQVDRGRYQPAVELARSIIDAQKAEIEEMQELLATL